MIWSSLWPRIPEICCAVVADRRHRSRNWARAAFWWQKAGETDSIELAHCYFKLGSKAMAVEILKRWPSDETRHCSVARLWSKIRTDLLLQYTRPPSCRRQGTGSENDASRFAIRIPRVWVKLRQSRPLP